MLVVASGACQSWHIGAKILELVKCLFLSLSDLLKTSEGHAKIKFLELKPVKVKANLTGGSKTNVNIGAVSPKYNSALDIFDFLEADCITKNTCGRLGNTYCLLDGTIRA